MMFIPCTLLSIWEFYWSHGSASFTFTVIKSASAVHSIIFLSNLFSCFPLVLHILLPYLLLFPFLLLSILLLLLLIIIFFFFLSFFFLFFSSSLSSSS